MESVSHCREFAMLAAFETKHIGYRERKGFD